MREQKPSRAGGEYTTFRRAGVEDENLNDDVFLVRSLTRLRKFPIAPYLYIPAVRGAMFFILHWLSCKDKKIL